MNFFDSFTKGAQRVLIIAQEEARRMGHNYVGTEHILLGTIKESRPSAPCSRSWA